MDGLDGRGAGRVEGTTMLIATASVGAGLLQAHLSANLIVAFLVLTFITVPTVLLLLEHLRSDHPEPPPSDAQAPEDAGEQDPLSLAELRARPSSPVEEAVLVIPAQELSSTPFGSGPPIEVGYLPPHARAHGALAYRGFLVIGEGAVLDGDLRVDGGLWARQGAQVTGDVQVNGDLHADEASCLAGTVILEGDAYLHSWCTVGAIEHAHGVWMAPGACIETTLKAESLVHGLGSPTADRPQPEPQPQPPVAGQAALDARQLQDLLTAWQKAALDPVMRGELGLGWADSPAGQTVLSEMVAPLRPLVFDLCGTVPPAEPPAPPSPAGSGLRPPEVTLRERI